MKRTNAERAIPITTLIAAFIYLVMCPSIHEFGDTIRHDVIYKVDTKTLKKNHRSDLESASLSLLSEVQTDPFTSLQHARTLTPFRFPSLLATLSILPTVRLLL